jgi:hypothetical protein
MFGHAQGRQPSIEDLQQQIDQLQETVRQLLELQAAPPQGAVGPAARPAGRKLTQASLPHVIDFGAGNTCFFSSDASDLEVTATSTTVFGSLILNTGALVIDTPEFLALDGASANLQSQLDDLDQRLAVLEGPPHNTANTRLHFALLTQHFCRRAPVVD